MKKITIGLLFVFAFTLMGCVPDSEDQERLKAALPSDCTVTNIEDYGSINLLVVVDCTNHSATSTAYHEPAGKHSRAVQVLYVGDN